MPSTKDYTLTWTEDGQPQTVYIRVSDTAAQLFASALTSEYAQGLTPAFADVKLTVAETSVADVDFPTNVPIPAPE